MFNRIKLTLHASYRMLSGLLLLLAAASTMLINSSLPLAACLIAIALLTSLFVRLAREHCLLRARNSIIALHLSHRGLFVTRADGHTFRAKPKPEALVLPWLMIIRLQSEQAVPRKLFSSSSVLVLCPLNVDDKDMFRRLRTAMQLRHPAIFSTTTPETIHAR